MVNYLTFLGYKIKDNFPIIIRIEEIYLFLSKKIKSLIDANERDIRVTLTNII